MNSQDIQLTSRKFHELEQVSPPTTLFHYTGQKGLLGIIKSGELWASKVQYMNDSTEFGYGITLAKELIYKRMEETGKNDDLFKFVFQRLDTINMINICAVSFCRDRDLLSQWRGYAGAGGGYAIGFYSAALLAIGSGRLSHCIYERSDQVQILSELIDQMLQYTSKLSPTDDPNSVLTDAFARALTQCGAFFKDSTFEQEDEWRLVTGVHL
jgi:hypothetical protein